MNISTVNELIQSLESAGELSIKETKIMALAKAYVQLAAENVGLKNVFGPGDAVLNFLTIALRHTTYDQIDLDDVTLAFKMSLPETPATDAYLAGIKADGVEEFVSNTVHKIFDESDAVSALAYLSLANSHVKQLREGADK
ncbi:TPA: hypothetical protein ACX3LH_006063 [Klebsiella michiganensis]